jgi:molybdopterin-guanine dinucleotide biosynthesis protein A
MQSFAPGTAVLRDFPIFGVRGGDRAAREQLRKILPGLDGLKVCYLPDKERSLSGYSLLQLVGLYDLVVVEPALALPTHIIQLENDGTTEEIANDGFMSLHCLMRSGRSDDFLENLKALLQELLLKTPVWACILIGGKSSRMGSPKHLLTDEVGRTWLARAIAMCRPLVQGVVVAGRGEVPEEIDEDIYRVPDIPGTAGPMAGIISCGRWLPRVSWLLVACDMPNLNTQAGEWLLAGRRPGNWGRIPRLPGKNTVDPLFAWYDYRALALFEELHLSGIRRIGKIAERPRIETAVIPPSLSDVWMNVNTPQQLQDYRAVSRLLQNR